jgi:hypothetical protein
MNYLNTSSPTPLELFMEHQFGLDRVRISHPFDAVDRNPDLSITRYDSRETIFSKDMTKRTFEFPRVDVVYNRKRYCGYVPLDTTVQHHKSLFTEVFAHVVDEDKLVANLEIMLQDIIDGVIYD